MPARGSSPTDRLKEVAHCAPVLLPPPQVEERAAFAFPMSRTAAPEDSSRGCGICMGGSRTDMWGRSPKSDRPHMSVCAGGAPILTKGVHLDSNPPT